jgi:hypothetical protein
MNLWARGSSKRESAILLSYKYNVVGGWPPPLMLIVACNRVAIRTGAGSRTGPSGGNAPG